MTKTKILIAEDHQMFRKGISTILNKLESFEIIGEASNGQEIVDLADRLNPDVILMDVHLPDFSGEEATYRILRKYPQVKILGLSAEDSEEAVVNMVRAGAKGYVLKDSSIDELVLAIKSLKGGNSYFSERVSSKLLSRLDHTGSLHENDKGKAKKRLTNREAEILKFITEELTNKEIADRLFISPRTVETHRRNLIHKLKVRNTVGLVKYYMNMVTELNGSENARY